MLRRKATLLVILIVLSLSVQYALAHLSGHTSASADARLETTGDDFYMLVEGDGVADVGPPGTFQHPAGYKHTADYYLHLTIAEVFPLETVYVIFFYKLIWDRRLTHTDDPKEKRRVYKTGDQKTRTLAGVCLRGTATSDMRMKYVDDDGNILSQTSSTDTDSYFACPGGTSGMSSKGISGINSMEAQGFTPDQHEAFREELADLVASANDPDVVGAFSVNGYLFLQRRGVTYTYIIDGREQRIESDEANASIERINVTDGMESALIELIPAAPPHYNYQRPRIATTWGSLKQG